MGFEPTASSMRPKRSSQLSYTPVGTVRVAQPPEPTTNRVWGGQGRVGTSHHEIGGPPMLAFILAAVLAIIGIVQLLQGQIILGILLLIAAVVVGPGGYSIFRDRRTTI